MSEPTTKALVPALRFPEFRDAGEWKERKLKQVCDINPKASVLPDSFIYIDLESVEAGVLLQKKAIQLEGAPSRAQRLLKNGDVIFQMVRPYQKNNYLFQPNDDFDYVASTGYAQLRAHQSNTYLYQYIHNERFVDRVLEKCTGSNYPAINSSDLAEIRLEIPQLEEQQKIADCLSSIDELVTAQTQKVEALKAHKKGLMQQLFPAEGETVPKLRFPEFRDTGEWNTCTLDEICSVSSGGTPSRSTSSFWNGNIPWITTTLIDINTINAANEYISEEGLKNSAAKIFPKNTILMAMYGQGKTRGKVAILGIDAAINQACAAITLKKGFDTNFVFQNLAARYDEIRDISNKGGQENLSAGLIKGIPFTYPDVKSKEQQKIADCLSSIDDLITAQAHKLEALKAHKKGLMQQLFPAVDEVAG